MILVYPKSDTVSPIDSLGQDIARRDIPNKLKTQFRLVSLTFSSIQITLVEPMPNKFGRPMQESMIPVGYLSYVPAKCQSLRETKDTWRFVVSPYH